MTLTIPFGFDNIRGLPEGGHEAVRVTRGHPEEVTRGHPEERSDEGSRSFEILRLAHNDGIYYQNDGI